MPVPAIEKTWQYDVNQIVAATGAALSENKATLAAIKNSLLTGCKAGGGGLSPWTVHYSCGFDGVSQIAGLAGDGVDRWGGGGISLVWAAAGAAHSWMVLKQPGIAANWQLLLSLEGAAGSGEIMTAYYSPAAGFTGGSSTARPTATDEQPILLSATWTSNGTAARRIHCQQSTDGQVTRVFIARSGSVVGYMEFAKAKNPRSTWTSPSFALMHGVNTGEAPLYATLHLAARAAIVQVAVAGTAFYTTEGAFNDSIGELQNSTDDYDAALPMTPIGLYSATSGARGRPGQVYDLWFGSTVAASGDSYDELGSRAFAQMGDLITPSGGVVYQTT